MKVGSLVLIALVGFASNGMAQGKIDSLKAKPEFARKGRLFLYGGYNRDAYTKSDIHIKGAGYDFTIKDVTAHDDQEPLSMEYVKPASMSVPQYNYRLGYYINDKTFISIGQDHMKYRIYRQTTSLTGYVNQDNNGGKNIGNYSNAQVIVGEAADDESHNQPVADSSRADGFVSRFKHCDGLNDITIEAGRTVDLWVARNGKHALSLLGAVGAGGDVLDTEADILGYPSKHNLGARKAYHLAGYSCSAIAGVDFTFFKNFFIQLRVKGGYINLPDINTTVEGGKASQHLGFIEYMGVIGYSYSFAKKN